MLCLVRTSFERAEDIILLRIEEGAAKWALRDLRLEEETFKLYEQNKPTCSALAMLDMRVQNKETPSVSRRAFQASEGVVVEMVVAAC
jgi:hypothetical protein